jgi:predicted ABC-class ATPase
MKLRLLGLGLSLTALAALYVLFDRAIRYWRELAMSNCGEAEAGGNCLALQRYRESGLVTCFIVAALILAALILLTHFKSTGK